MQETSITTTNDLISDVFKKVGCTPDNRGNNAFGVTYRDVYVTIQVNENLHTLTLYDLHWYKVSEDDIDGMLRVTKEINRINSFGGIKFVFNKFDDGFYVSSALTISFIAEIPRLDDYLTNQLNTLLSYRKVFQTEENESQMNNAKEV